MGTKRKIDWLWAGSVSLVLFSVFGLVYILWNNYQAEHEISIASIIGALLVIAFLVALIGVAFDFRDKTRPPD
jgi:hypothetical protein